MPTSKKTKVPESDIHIRVWHFATDAAPDQKHCSAIVEKETLNKFLDIHLHQYCLFHQLQLTILKILKFARHNYFSNLATLMNFWRSPGRV